MKRLCLAILADGAEEGVPCVPLRLIILAGTGGGPTTKGSALRRRLAVLAGWVWGPLVGESAPRRLVILAGGVGGLLAKGSAQRFCLAIMVGGEKKKKYRRQI